MWDFIPRFLTPDYAPAVQRLRNLARDILRLGPGAVGKEDLRELRERMDKPQRHRLLHGYPLAQAMPHRADASQPADVRFEPGCGRGLLMGVLPHPFCNPAVAGCGFCTFPHQPYHADHAAATVERVLQEI